MLFPLLPCKKERECVPLQESTDRLLRASTATRIARMALAASRQGWKQLHSSWARRSDVSRCLCAAGPRELHHNGHAVLFRARPRHIATAALSLRVYSSADCPLCDGLKEKLEALRERGKFQQDIWSNMRIEVRKGKQ